MEWLTFHLETRLDKNYSLRSSSTLRMYSTNLFINPTLDRLLGFLPKAKKSKMTNPLFPLGSYYGSVTSRNSWTRPRVKLCMKTRPL